MELTIGIAGATGWAGRALVPAVLAAALLLPAAATARDDGRRSVLGHSERGRAIVAVHAGDPAGPRVLVFGAIHGDELAGLAVTRALERLRSGPDLWIVPDLNPGGAALGVRQDARGVDLNRNWSSRWRRGGRPWDTYYGGPRPFSERETRIARRLIRRVHPAVTIWLHQHMDLVWVWGRRSVAAGRRYARAAHMRLYRHPSLRGTATAWQRHHLRGTAALTVELPVGRLSAAAVRRHVRAVLAAAP